MRDLAAIESALRLVERQVWIVTASDGQRRGGLVATWVSQASIDSQSPVMATAIAVNHFTRELIDAGGGFGLHLINTAQIGQAWRFGMGSGRDRDKFAGVEFDRGESGSPILRNCLAWFDCRVFHRYDGGDRIYYWADVLSAGAHGEASPLTDRQLFAAASPDQLAQLRVELDADIAIQRPLLAAWRSRQ